MTTTTTMIHEHKNTYDDTRAHRHQDTQRTDTSPQILTRIFEGLVT